MADSQDQPIPLLVFLHGRHGGTQTFFSPFGNCYHKKCIEGMRNKSLWASFGSWLLLDDDEDGSLFLFDLVSMERIDLPLLAEPLFPKHEAETGIPVMSSAPTDPEFVIYIFKMQEPIFFSFKSGDDAWIRQEYELDVLAEDHIVKAISREGKIFLITSDEDTAVVEVLPQLTVTVLILERSYTRPGHLYSTYFLDSCGEIFLIRKFYYGLTREVETVEVFKADFVEMIWEKVESTDARMFFFDRSTHLCYGSS